MCTLKRKLVEEASKQAIEALKMEENREPYASLEISLKYLTDISGHAARANALVEFGEEWFGDTSVNDAVMENIMKAKARGEVC